MNAQTQTQKTNAYQLEVLNVNKEFKIALRSTNKAIKILIASETLNSKQVGILKAILKDDKKYKDFDGTVRRTKAGQITPFYVLQALYKATTKK
jgi:hypothetical protein